MNIHPTHGTSRNLKDGETRPTSLHHARQKDLTLLTIFIVSISEKNAEELLPGIHLKNS